MIISDRLQHIIDTTPEQYLHDVIMRNFWLEAIHDNTCAAIIAIDQNEPDVARYWLERIDQYISGRAGAAIPGEDCM